MRPFTSMLGRLELVGLGWLVGVAGGAGFVASFASTDLLRPLALGGLVGVVAAVCGRSRLLVGMACLLGLLAIGTFPAVGAGPSVLTAAFGDAGLGAIKDAISVPATPETLAVPYLATALAAFVAVRVGRSGWHWTALLPSFGVLLLGLLVGDPAGPVPWPVPAVWAAIALLVVSWRGGLGLGAQLLSTSFKLVALAVIVMVGAVPLGELVPVREERTVVPHSPGAYPMPETQPLATVVGLRSGPNEVLFTADTSAPVPRWRLTVLDQYDGRSWSRRSADYRPSAERLPEVPGADLDADTETTQSVQLHLEDGAAQPVWGRWLPTADGPVETSQDNLLFDRATASLASYEDAPAPETYEIVSRHAEWDMDALSEASAADDAEARANLGLDLESDSDELQEVLDELDVVAEELTAGATSDHGRAAALSRYLTTEGELLVEEDAQSGHTLRHVQQLVLHPEGVQGTAEQYASAYAVLARRLDLPTRIVVGFRGSGVTGESQVRANDANAWAEVRFDEVGWVPFEVVPTETGEVGSAPEPAPEPEPEEVPEEEDDAADEVEDEPAEAAGSDSGDDGGPSLRGVSDSGSYLALLAAVLVAAIGIAQVPALRRARRRQQRTRGTSPAERVAGAWATVLDDLSLAGVPRLSERTAGTAVVQASRQVPTVGEELVELSALANRSAFSVQGPQDGDGERAWALARSIVHTRRAGRSRGRRLSEYFRW